MNTGPVLIVDDDDDDRQFLMEAWKDLKYENPLIFFGYGEQVLDYLNSNKTTPFLILCDVNIPRMNGFELKEKIQQNRDADHKSVPFVFWSSTITPAQVKQAYDLGGNGFFEKEMNLNDLKQSLVEIVQYWMKSKTPK